MILANINTLWAHVIVDELVRCGVRHAVVSPGSRSTPLTMALSRHPDIEDISVIDERSAGFFAVGMAIRSGLPVVLVCTSGTAAANYLPAVCEAHHSAVPLIVLTADRPAWLRDSGASQAMNQVNLFGQYVAWFHEIAQPQPSELLLRYVRTTIDKAVFAAAAGPVHLNIPLDKPLEPTVVRPEDLGGVGELTDTSPAVRGAANGVPWVRHTTSEELGDVWAACEFLRVATRPMVVVGAMADGWKLRDEITAWHGAGVPVLAEAASQLRFGKTSQCVLATDTWLNDSKNRESLRPDVIVFAGRAPINWPTQKWLAQQTCPIVFIGPAAPVHSTNPDHLSGIHIHGAVLPALRRLRQGLPVLDRAWLQDVEHVVRVAPSVPAAWSDSAVHEVLASTLEDGATVFVSSSMPLRDLECHWTTERDIQILFNRGLNGIDGVLSTAFGAAKVGPGDLYVLVGDVAFAHDIGALLTAKRAGVQATIVVIDNAGGAIFDHLPVRQFDSEAFAKHFTTTPEHNLEAIAAAYDMDYHRVTSHAELAACLHGSGLRLIHAVTREHDDPSKRPFPRPTGSTSPMDSRPYQSSPRQETKLVLIHGFTDTSDSWAFIGDKFEGLPVHRLGLPGHGGQTLATHWDECLEDFRSSIGEGSCHLVGYSMGGRLALGYALKFGKQVVSLTTVGAHAGLPDDERSERVDIDEGLAKLAESDLNGFLRTWDQTPILNLGPKDFRTRDAKLRRRRGNRGAGLADALRKLGPAKMPILRPEDLAMKAMFVAGALDKKYTAIAHELAVRAPKGRVEIVEDAGHAVHEDQPHAFLRILADHIR